LHQGLTVDTAPSREQHREGKGESAIETATQEALALLEKLEAEEPENSVAIDRVKIFLHRISHWARNQ